LVNTPRVVIATEARTDVAALPPTMLARLDDVITRLEARPNVPGANPFR
jgi:hypothetical protein